MMNFEKDVTIEAFVQAHLLQTQDSGVFSYNYWDEDEMGVSHEVPCVMLVLTGNQAAEMYERICLALDLPHRSNPKELH